MQTWAWIVVCLQADLVTLGETLTSVCLASGRALQGS